MAENKPVDFGDVHAPVEDTDVPFGLKLLVVVMLLTLVGLATVVGMALSRLPISLIGS